MKNNYIGLLVEDTASLLVGLLGIFKSGNSVVPLSPRFPVERIAYIVKDCRLKVLLTDTVNYAAALDVKETCSCLEHVICIEGIESQGVKRIGSPDPISMSLPCYVIYTSGSTGKPKGVIITYDNLIPLLLWFQDHFHLGNHTRVFQNLSYTFDFGIFELLTTLIAGGVLFFFNKKKISDLNDYGEFIRSHQIDTIHTTPSFFSNIIESAGNVPTLKLVHLGGEKLSRAIVEDISIRVGENCMIYNGYGPTETTINSAIYSMKVESGGQIKSPENIPIGKPSANNINYILDPGGNLQPIGLVGELYIGGEGVSQGYLNNPELTSQKFIMPSATRNPFEKGFLDLPKLYRTGDLTRWLSDGNIEYLGRIDHQVKIRGFRIELGEIENRILAHEEIKDSAVVAREDEKGNKYLIAYVVPQSSGARISNLTSILREYLKEQLPDYMIPSYFVTLDTLPLTVNGKIDLKALPEPENKEKTSYAAPRNAIEEKLIEIWSEILGKQETIGIDDNFFEIGGHSLKATLLVSKIHKTFNIKIPLLEIFHTPTIEGLSKYIRETKREKYESIEAVEEKEYYPLSSAQERLYFLNRIQENSTAYNIPYAVQMEGEIDINRIEDVFKSLISRHESLRTSFELIEEEPVQRIHPEVDFNIMTFPLTEVLGPTLFQKGRFDLTKAPLMRVGIIKIEERKHIFRIDIHHIISDGMSAQTLVNDFSVLYTGGKLSENRLQYKDYAEWQKQNKNNKRFTQQEEYWKNEYQGEIPVLELPTDYPRPSVQSFEGDRINFALCGETTSSLKGLALETGTTTYMILLGIYQVFLSKVSGQEEIVIGTPVAGRRHADLEKIIGMFVNTLALRNNPSGEKTFTDFLGEVKEKTLKALENQDYQYEDLLEQLSIERDIARNPLFDTMFALQNTGTQKMEIPGLTLTSYETENKTSKFDLTLIGEEEKDKIQFTLEYSTKLFKQETIERFIAYFKKIVKEVTESRDRKISEIEIIAEEEKNRILYEFNGAEREYPKDKTIHELFRGQAKKTPDCVSIVGAAPCYPSCLTYKELDKQSDALAHELMEKGVLPGAIVGIIIERSIEMIIGILGILKTGAAYLPLNPKNPQERTDFMLKDSNAKILLTACSVCQDKINKSSLPTFFQESTVAYIIYTSGSTGNPKGVPITHANFCPLMHWGYERLGLTTEDRTVQNLSYYFDWSVWEIFITLTSGASLYMVSGKIILDSERYIDFINRNRITVLHITPTHFQTLIHGERKLNTLRHLCIGAEKLTNDLVKRSLEVVDETCRLYNMYGPTEATIMAAVLEIDRKDLESYSLLSSAPIGKPTGNNTLSIVDKYINLCPVNIVGELVIGGEGVANGYLNNPELTAERFIVPSATKNPFEKGFLDLPKLLLYKTGDLARWLLDGTIEYLGRIDHQVKIRGYRIELGEIENVLLKHESVEEAVVQSKGENLCAYIVAKVGKEITGINAYLSNKLPDYMVPAHIMKLEKIPLNPNGKIDLTALPKPDLEELSEYEYPRDLIEEKLAAIWSEVLGKQESIGIDDNFFHLGGHSLKATQLVSKIHKNLNINFPLSEVFKTPTIRGISGYIKEAAEATYKEIEAEEAKEYYGLSSAQKRLHFLNQIDKNGTSYNIPAAWILEGELDIKKLEDTFERLIERHESLRTSFELIEEEPVQRIHSKVDFKIMNHPLTKVFGPTFFQKGRFDLTKAPLMRVELIKQEEEKYILFVEMSHIITDGASMRILVKEFMAQYREMELPGLRIQYKDYSEWQNRNNRISSMKKQELYWENKFSDEIPVLELPTDYARPVIQELEGSSIGFEINNEIVEKLKAMTKETGTTLYMMLLAIYNILLSKLSGGEDIVIGTPVAGRRRADLENIIGMFVNTLALRNNPSGEKTFTDFLHEVKEKTLEALENQDYQYEELVEQLSINRDVSRNPLFDTMFSLQNTGITGIEIPGMKLKPYDFENKTSKFDLTLIVVEAEKEKLLFTFEYSTKLFKPETIERIIDYFKKIINDVTETKDRRISEIEIITNEEKKRILYDFNDTEREYPNDKTIHELFRGQAKKTPDYIVGYPSYLTYKELDEQSDSLAHELIEKGVLPDDIVGIQVERSIEMVVGILGILKSGAAYMPIDPDYPQERIDYMIKDSGAKFLSTSQLHSFHLLPATGNRQPANSLAYIIYTSGTTGKPKGVMVEHRNAVNTINWFVEAHRIGIGTRVLQVSNYTFDASVNQVFGPSISGAGVYIVAKEIRSDIEKLRDYIDKHRINIINFTPTLFKELLCERDKLKSLHTVLSGAEKLDEATKEGILEKGYRLVNQYGPTETTIDALALECASEKVTLGKPIFNVNVFVLDKYEQIQPIGIVGELYIAGAGVSRGYLNRPELTNERFIKGQACLSPTLTLNTNTLYRSGDLARWNTNGNIEYLGRVDQQVKIRGYRIELGEIENVLLRHESVRDAVVQANGENLCAYIVSAHEIPGPGLREYLSKQLPDYMIPTYFTRIEKIPLTSSGKIDKKSLPAPEIKSGESNVAPQNELEMTLVAIWSETLGIEAQRIGIDDNFFQLGGHSLKATRVISKILRRLEIKISFAEIFRNPTIRELSGLIQKTGKDKHRSIEPVEEKEYYDLSSAQRRYYILQQMDPENTSFNITEVFTCEGALDIERFRDAFERLIKRHEIFRTTYESIGVKLIQKIQPDVKFEIEPIDEKIQNFIRPFDLSKAPLLRVGRQKLEDEKHMIILDVHHISSDGLSQQLLANEFKALYGGIEPASLKIQYKDFAEWQNCERARREIKKMEEYWLGQYRENVPVLDLPTDYKREKVQQFEGDFTRFEIGSQDLNTLEKLASNQGTTLYITLLAICNIWLHKICAQDTIVIGTGVGGRKNPDLQNMIGSLQNMIVLINNPDGEQPFYDFLDNVKQQTLEALENQDYPFDELVAKVAAHRETGRNPLFDFFYILNDMENSFADTGGAQIETPGLTFKAYTGGADYRKGKTRFDLALYGIKKGTTLTFTMEYSTKLFKTEKIEQWVEFYKTALSTVLEQKNIRLKEIEILPENVRKQILYGFNDTKADYSRDKTMNRLFEEQVARTPENIAVINEEKQLTYSRLNEKTNRLAHELRKKGLKPNRYAAVIMNRSIEMVIGVMAILKAGGAYVPLEPYLPEARINTCLNSLNAEIILTERTHLSKIEKIKEESSGIKQILLLDERDEEIEKNLGKNLEPTATSEDIAYVIFTSGTTGTPKGVVVKHKPVINIIEWVNKTYNVSGTDKLLFVVSLSFDLSVYDIFGILASGGTVRIAGNEDVKSPELLLEIITEEGITFWDSAPAALQLLIPNIKQIPGTEGADRKSKLRLVFLSGDWIPLTMPGILKKTFKGVEVIGLGGATEATIWSNYYPIGEIDPAWVSVPYGKPIQNAAYYILDRYLNPCPIGAAGDLYIGGECLASGYNDKDLTEQKFINNPFVPGEMMYRTGDMAKWYPDGNMEFLGRMDNQVKIRGYRIELGEIESQLLKHKEIKEAVVIAKGEAREDRYLCAYYVTDEPTLTPAELNRYLSGTLPAYMIPPYFVKLDKTPLTPNGKVDRKRLPEPVISVHEDYVAPCDQIEEELVAIWSEVLKIEKGRISVDSDFFEMGGHSLRATNVVSLIHEKMNVKVPLADIFRTPTIRELSGLIRQTAKDKYLSIEAVEEKEYYAASSAQRRLYFIQKRDPENTIFNIPGILELTGEQDKKKIKEAFEKLIRRHKSLRTYFSVVEGHVAQRIQNEAVFEIEYYDGSLTQNLREFVRPFDLSVAPLLRVGMVKIEEEKNVLMIDMSHIITDGVSVEILLEDFRAYNEGIEAPELKIQYNDFTEWQTRDAARKNMDRQLEYWMSIFADGVPVLNMPTNHPRPKIQTFAGDKITFTIEKELREKIREIETKSGATLFMILLAALDVLLMKYSGQEDIVVGFPVSGRRHADLIRVVGMFVNLLAMRNRPGGEKTFEEFLKEVQESSIQAFENQDAPFDELVDRLKLKVDPSRNPLFDICIFLQNFTDKHGKIEEMESSEYYIKKSTQFDMEIGAYEVMDGIYISLGYSTAIYERSTIEKMAKRYVEILEQVVRNTGIKLKNIQVTQKLLTLQSNVLSNEDGDFGI